MILLDANLIGRLFSRVLHLCFPKGKTTKPPRGGLEQAVHPTRKSGAGEGARTLDPDLGKVRLFRAKQ